MSLKVIDLTKRFGGLTAVDNVNYEMGEENLSALIGPNGAGKTTFLNLLAGGLKPTQGKIYMEGEDITALPVYKRVAKGLVKTFQISSIFDNLSVLENLVASICYHRLKNKRDFFFGQWEKEESVKEAERILKEVGLFDERHKKAGSLPPGYRKRLEIGLVIALKPKIILLDEPMAGLTHQETFEIMDEIRNLSRKHKIILVEHKMHVVMGLAERISVMHQGKIIADGTPDEISDNLLVRKVYLGEEVLA